MKTVTLKNIHKSFLERPLLKGASFKVSENEKICIVGENGAGKSTILKIFSKTLEADSGTIEHNGHIRTHYVAQEFDKSALDLTVEQYIEKYLSVTLSNKVYTLSKRLGYDFSKNEDKKCKLFSGGQQKILMMAVALSVVPDFLLLDEPENHLDIVSRLELIALLKEYKGGILFVSHDRMLIDALADKVAEVTEGKVFISEGGYQEYLDTRLARIAGLQREFDSEAKRIKQLENMLPILQSKAFRGKEVSSYAKHKAELLELKQRHKDSPRAGDNKTRIRLQKSSSDLHSGKLLCRITDASFDYKGAKGDIFRKVNLEIRTGSHIVLLGRNGSGKSTFLKCLTGNENFVSGSIKWAENITSAYFDQHAQFDPEETAMQVVVSILGVTDQKAKAALGAMKFSPEKMETKTGSLSGGERMRLRFALVFGINADFIILDEPTNNLDEVTWEILLGACNTTKSTILLVTHDYEFINDLNDKKFWLIKNQSIIERHKDLEEIIEELR